MNLPPDDSFQTNPFLIPPGDPFAASRGGPNPPADVNPYLLHPGGPPAAHARTSTSAAAIISLIMGLLSFPLLCACGVSIVPSLLGIVLGHVARARIRGSAGQLAGGGMAIAGLTLSYVSLLLLVVLWTVPFAFRAMLPEGGQVASGPVRSPLSVAESKITSDSQGIAHGNSPRAEELAKAFAEAMEEFDQEAFEETGRPGILSGGHYVTYCELHDDSCAFVTHVPNYRRFDREAKKYLAEGAWQIAQAVVQSDLPPDGKLAVGLRGVLLYGTVMIGEVGEEDVDLEPEYDGDDRDRLAVFLEGQQPEEEPSIDLDRPSAEGESDLNAQDEVEYDGESEVEVDDDSDFDDSDFDDSDFDESMDETGDLAAESQDDDENPFESKDAAGDSESEAPDEDDENPFESKLDANDSGPKEPQDEENPFE